MRLNFFVNDVLDPLVFFVVGDYYRDLNDLVQVQDEVDDHYGQAEFERCDVSDRHDKCPHRDGIADEAELRVSTCREDAADERGVYRSSEDIVAAHQEHDEQVVFCCFCKVNEVEDQRCRCSCDKAQDDPGDHCYLKELIAVYLSLFKSARAKLVADDDDASACDGKAKAGNKVFDNRCNTVGSRSIRAQMAHDNGDHGKAESPEKGIQKVGKGVLRESLP